MEGSDDYFGGGGGGGFIAGSNSPPGAGGSNKSYNKGGSDKKTTIQSVTVKQVDSAAQRSPSEPWVIDEKVELSHFRIVGRLTDIGDELSFCLFVVHDGTGSMQFQYYPDMGSKNWIAKRSRMTKGTYVEVLAESSPKKKYTTTLVRILPEPNHITRHLLQVVYTHLSNTRSLPAKALASTGAMGMGSYSTFSPHTGMSFGASIDQPGEGDDRGLSGIGKIVFDIFKAGAEDSTDGLHRDDAIKRGKAKGVPQDQVLNAIQTLLMDGLIYSTIDDLHFMCGYLSAMYAVIAVMSQDGCLSTTFPPSGKA